MGVGPLLGGATILIAIIVGLIVMTGILVTNGHASGSTNSTIKFASQEVIEEYHSATPAPTTAAPTPAPPSPTGP